MRIQANFLRSGVIERVKDYLAQNEITNTGIICSSVGTIQVITRDKKPDFCLPGDVIHEVLEDVTGKRKVVVFRLASNIDKSRYKIIVAGTISKFRNTSRDIRTNFVLDIKDLPGGLETYVLRFLGS